MNITVKERDIKDNKSLDDPQVKRAIGTKMTLSIKIPMPTMEKYSLNLFENFNLL